MTRSSTMVRCVFFLPVPGASGTTGRPSACLASSIPLGLPGLISGRPFNLSRPGKFSSAVFGEFCVQGRNFAKQFQAQVLQHRNSTDIEGHERWLDHCAIRDRNRRLGNPTTNQMSHIDATTT